MAKLVWAGVKSEVKCSEAELAEMLKEAAGDEIFIGAWLGAVNEIGFESAMMIARGYCEELEEE